MNSQRRPFFLHIGTRKSGTSYLQAALRESAPALKSQGVGMPFSDWRDHFHRLLTPLMKYDEGDVAAARRELKSMASRCAGLSEPRLLASFEDLAELKPEQISLLIEALADFEVHVVITARHWGKAIPSEWQQCVKERLLLSFPDYVQAISQRSGEDAERFMQRQDVAEIVARWAAATSPDRVHLIPLPAKLSDPGLLPRLFCELIDVKAESLSEPPRLVNPSLGYPQAETLRRINIALGDRLPDFMNEYRAAVRGVLRGPLWGQKGATPTIPPGMRAWCEQESRAQVEKIRATGCQVSGDLTDLIASDWSADGAAEGPTDSDVAAVATSALADLAVTSMAKKSKVRKPGDAGAPAIVALRNPGSSSRLRRAAGRVRRSLSAPVVEPSKVRAQKPGPGAAPVSAKGFRYVFVVTYGRSGSTLVQGLLNALPRTLVRGENNLYVLPLYRAESLAGKFKRTHASHGVGNAKSAFYGLGEIDRANFAAATNQLVVSQILGNKAARNFDVVGFKEVLWHRIPDDDIADFFDFMDIAFPGALYVLNTRDHGKVVGSGFWQSGTEDEARAAIAKVETLQEHLRVTRPDRTFDTVYENLTSRDAAVVDAQLRGLAEFVHGSVDDGMLTRMRETLSEGHGPNPFGASRGRREEQPQSQ